MKQTETGKEEGSLYIIYNGELVRVKDLPHKRFVEFLATIEKLISASFEKENDLEIVEYPLNACVDCNGTGILQSKWVCPRCMGTGNFKK